MHETETRPRRDRNETRDVAGPETLAETYTVKTVKPTTNTDQGHKRCFRRLG